VPLPPFAEQNRIVAAMEEQFSRLDSATAILVSAGKWLERLRSATFATAFRKDRWPRTTLGDIADVVGGVTKDSKRQDDPGNVEVPYLRVANVQRGYLDLREITTIRVPAEKASRLRLQRGDILFNEGGDRDKLGRGWVWEGQIDPCIHQNHVFRARLRTAEFEPKFVSMYGNDSSAWFERMGKQTTNLASISMRTLKMLPIPAPPVDEQRKIVADIELQRSLANALESAIGQALARGEQLRRAILERAFTGKLVAQDPNDVPASVLLERIRAQRESAEPAARRSRNRASAGSA
jgi:type I restriction enzyme S subunit